MTQHVTRHITNIAVKRNEGKTLYYVSVIAAHAFSRKGGGGEVGSEGRDGDRLCNRYSVSLSGERGGEWGMGKGGRG